MSNIVIEKWDEILETMKNEYDISDVSFNTWLKPLKVHNITDNTLTILAADEIHANYIEKKYSKQFIVTIGEITGISYQLHFIKPDDILREEQNALEGKNGLASSKLDNLSDNNATANLNPRYTFDTFVVGTNNSFAHAASLAVAESPGEIYNPLFIYGGVGLGKTHLMHSIAHFILERNPRTRVLYVTSEKFTNEIIDAIRKKTIFLRSNSVKSIAMWTFFLLMIFNSL